MRTALFLGLLTTLIAGCATTPTAPVRSECFRADGSARCKFTPLPELWQDHGGHNA